MLHLCDGVLVERHLDRDPDQLNKARTAILIRLSNDNHKNSKYSKPSPVQRVKVDWNKHKHANENRGYSSVEFVVKVEGESKVLKNGGFGRLAKVTGALLI